MHWIPFWVIFFIGLIPFIVRLRMSASHRAVLVIVLVIVLASAFAWQKRIPAAPNIPVTVTDRGYVSSKTCKTCHIEHYSSWHQTYHRTMTQLASPETVVAPFDNVSLYSRGRTYVLEREGDKFYVSMADPEFEWAQMLRKRDLTQIRPPIVRREIVMTTGSHHMQGYWINAGGGNKMFQIPWYYVFDEKRWIPREDCFLADPKGPRHFQIWNVACIHCHAVAGNPNLDKSKGVVESRVAEFGIACEACHGPGGAHVKKHQNLLSRLRDWKNKDGEDPTIVNPAKKSPKVQSQICGQCHSFYDTQFPEGQFNLDDSNSYQPGDDLAETHRVIRFSDANKKELAEKVKAAYWDDGTCRVGGDELNGLLDSPCYKGKSFSCLSCHSMHKAEQPNDLLGKGMGSNEACLQCHQEKRQNLQAHTHHAPDSSGSLCYNCHMPHTSYALFSAMRSHRIDKPDLRRSLATQRPNACNLCHMDKTLAWTDKHLVEWFGHSPAKLDSEQRRTAASILNLTRGNAVQRQIATWHLGWEPAMKVSGTGWQPGHLAPLLNDAYPAIRVVARRALRKQPGYKDWDYEFIAPDKDLLKSRAALWKRWENRTDARKAISALLIDASGGIDQARFKQLLQQRNNETSYVPQ